MDFPEYNMVTETPPIEFNQVTAWSNYAMSYVLADVTGGLFYYYGYGYFYDTTLLIPAITFTDGDYEYNYSPYGSVIAVYRATVTI
jgi:hypothetical protein